YFDEGSGSNGGTQATDVLMYSVCLGPNFTHIIQTENLSPNWGDPVMHLLRYQQGSWQEVAFADDTGSGNNSQIWYYFNGNGDPGCVQHKVVVRAYDNQSGGNGGVFYDLR